MATVTAMVTAMAMAMEMRRSSKAIEMNCLSVFFLFCQVVIRFWTGEYDALSGKLC